jgi:ankyrin repeat protein
MTRRLQPLFALIVIMAMATPYAAATAVFVPAKIAKERALFDETERRLSTKADQAIREKKWALVMINGAFRGGPGGAWCSGPTKPGQIASFIVGDFMDPNRFRRSEIAAKINARMVRAMRAAGDDSCSLENALYPYNTDARRKLLNALKPCPEGQRFSDVSAAAQNGCLAEVQRLLASGARPGWRDASNLDGVSWAIIRGDQAMLGSLLATGAPIKRRAPTELSPLSLAAEFGRVDAVRLLLKQGADANEGMPLRDAAASGSLPIAAALIAAGARVDPDASWSSGPLDMAAARGDVKMLRFLLSKRADPNWVAKHGDRMPLEHAIIHESEGSVRALLDAGADPNHLGNSGLRPLSQAVRQCPVKVGIVRALLNGGAKRDATGADWRPALTPLEEFTYHDCEGRAETPPRDRRLILRLLAGG